MQLSYRRRDAHYPVGGLLQTLQRSPRHDRKTKATRELPICDAFRLIVRPESDKTLIFSMDWWTAYMNPKNSRRRVFSAFNAGIILLCMSGIAHAQNVAGNSGYTLAQRCDAGHHFVIYHGSWDHEPSAKERAGMREYTQDVTKCIAVWKARCTPLLLFPTGTTNAFCEIQADYALAHLNNRRELERRNETYREYDSRADEIDRVFKETADNFFASMQKPIDDYNESKRQEREAQERQAAAQREEELISVLRQLSMPRPLTTQCAGGDGTVQCTTY